MGADRHPNQPRAFVDVEDIENLFEEIEDLVVPAQNKATVLIFKDRQRQLKIVATLSKTNKTVFSLADAVFLNFIRRFEATSGLKVFDPMDDRQPPPDLRTVDPADIEDQPGGPDENQTSLAVTRAVRMALKRIAAHEEKTIFSIVDAVLQDFIDLIETAAGRPLLSRFHR